MRLREEALVSGERELKRHIKRMQVVGSILESKDERKNNNEGGQRVFVCCWLLLCFNASV